MKKKATLRPLRYLSPDHLAEAAIKSYEQKNNTLCKDISYNLKAQNGSLSERVIVRRDSRAGLSPPLGATEASFSSVHKKIEEVIEELLVQKMAEIKEVKKRYKTMISNDNVADIVEEMNREVEKIEEAFVERKKNAMAELL